MSASLVPDHSHDTVYLVLDDVTPFGHVWIETGEDEANEATVIRWIIEEQFKRPLRGTDPRLTRISCSTGRQIAIVV